VSKVNVRFIDGIPEATEVVDNLDSDKTTASLSAKQGKALKNLIDNITVPGVIDNLTSDDADKVLSAKQGKILKNMVDNITVPSVVDDLNSDNTTSALSAKQGKALKALVDGKITPPPNDGKVYCFYQNEWIELRGVEIKEE